MAVQEEEEMKRILNLVAGLLGIGMAIVDFIPPTKTLTVIVGILLVILSIANLVIFVYANNYFGRGRNG